MDSSFSMGDACKDGQGVTAGLLRDACLCQHGADGGPGAVGMMLLNCIHLHLDTALPGAIDLFSAELDFSGDHGVDHGADLFQVGTGIHQCPQ